MRKILTPRSMTSCPGGFTHHGAAVGAVGYEVLGDKITFGDHVLYSLRQSGKAWRKSSAA